MNPRKLISGSLLVMTYLCAWGSHASGQNVKYLDLDKGSFHVTYCQELGIPLRVDWVVSKDYLGITKREPSFRFRSESLAPRPRVASRDYSNSGYQRGHMCPAGDRSASKALMKSTFIMSNVCPMTPALNTGAWKRTEILERWIAGKAKSSRVSACPLFFPHDTAWIGRHKVAVPHAFMKVITIDGNPFFYKLFILENK